MQKTWYSLEEILNLYYSNEIDSWNRCDLKCGCLNNRTESWRNRWDSNLTRKNSQYNFWRTFSRRGSYRRSLNPDSIMTQLLKEDTKGSVYNHQVPLRNPSMSDIGVCHLEAPTARRQLVVASSLRCGNILIHFNRLWIAKVGKAHDNDLYVFIFRFEMNQPISKRFTLEDMETYFHNYVPCDKHP